MLTCWIHLHSLGAFLLIAATSGLASYLPARRAGRINIVDALRNE